MKALGVSLIQFLDFVTLDTPHITPETRPTSIQTHHSKESAFLHASIRALETTHIIYKAHHISIHLIRPPLGVPE